MSLAAVGVASSIAAVAATQPESVSASPYDLAALIVVGSSTHPDGSGNEDFFQGKFNAAPYTTEGGVVHVNFYSGVAGINEALQAHSGQTNAILASGWGAANASLLLRQLDAVHDPALPKTLFVLDNDVSRPTGGFGTTYPLFALIGVNPLPTPSDTAAPQINTGYAYDYNSSAPVDFWNPLAAVNSLVAYLYRHLNQNELTLPVDATCGAANTCGVTDNGLSLPCPDAQCGVVPPGDRVAAYVTKRGNTTYVTYTSNGLPLTNLIRDFVPFGNFIADLTEPLLTVLVNSAYINGNPIPADPSKYQPARLFPPPSDIISTVAKIPGAILQGLQNVAGGGSSASSNKTAVTTFTTTQTTARLGEEPKSATDEDPKLLTNVVRDSLKAVPGSTGLEGSTATETKPVATVESSAIPTPTQPTKTEEPEPTTVDLPEHTPASEAEGAAA